VLQQNTIPLYDPLRSEYFSNKIKVRFYSYCTEEYHAAAPDGTYVVSSTTAFGHFVSQLRSIRQMPKMALPAHRSEGNFLQHTASLYGAHFSGFSTLQLAHIS
jgi:hypothetical protein